MNEYIHDTGLPADIERDLNAQLLADKGFRKLQNKCMDATLHHRLVEAARLSGEMYDYARRFASTAYKRLIKEQNDSRSLMSEMTTEDNNNFIVSAFTILAVADLLEYSIMDLNQILHRYAPEQTFHAFDRMNVLLSEAQTFVRFLGSSTSMDFQTDFADTADDVAELILNKVTKFARRHSEKINRQHSTSAVQ